MDEKEGEKWTVLGLSFYIDCNLLDLGKVKLGKHLVKAGGKRLIEQYGVIT